MNPQFIDKIAAKIRAKAEELRISAGYGGYSGDNGAGMLLSNLEMWLDGIRGEIPKSFKQYMDDVQKESDPEWDEYQCMKKKFEGK
jgi:hypothetical protein